MGGNESLKVLVELRPALDGHAGIPQETRLLFGALGSDKNIELHGLLQTSFTFLPDGIDEATKSLPRHEKVNRFSNVVISLSENGEKKKIVNEVAKYFRRRFATIYWLLINFFASSRSRIKPTKFESGGFEDFVWRRIFEKTLPSSDFNAVTKKDLSICSIPWGVMQMVGAWSSRLTGTAKFPVIDLEHFDIFIAQTPYPCRLSGSTGLIVRYHDAVPMFLPHTIGHMQKHQASHYQALLSNVKDGAYFACVSDATRDDLLRLFPEIEDRALTIHNMASSHYFVEDQNIERARSIIRSRVSSDKQLRPAFTSMDDQEKFYRENLLENPIRYLLMVSTLEPRKNHLALIDAWQSLRDRHDAGLKLVLVGNKGWGSEVLTRRTRPFLDQGQMYVLNAVPADELRVLYRNAQATVCPSFAEGFDYSGIEAMQSDGLVVASEIPVHREVYSDGALYFNPYDHRELTAALQQMLYSDSKMETASQLRLNGSGVVKCYSRESIMPKWHAFLANVAAKRNVAE